MWTTMNFAAAIAASALLVGCATEQKPAVANPDVTPPAVTCKKCDTTWVRIPSQQKGRVVAYSTRKAMTCPDCVSAAHNFFATGKLEHACKTCGADAMKICESH